MSRAWARVVVDTMISASVNGIPTDGDCDVSDIKSCVLGSVIFTGRSTVKSLLVLFSKKKLSNGGYRYTYICSLQVTLYYTPRNL